MVSVGNPFVKIDFVRLMTFLIMGLKLLPSKDGFLVLAIEISLLFFFSILYNILALLCCLLLNLGRLDMKICLRESPDIGENNLGITNKKPNLCSSSK